ncbi:glutathione synthase [Hesseltinella vesiculosa]|uniref:Glutathione synthetase n=1 Tax=Hesseltinella vesiculosa TaxID=101127 RepID=A0A1X2GCD4_9FUNG|nr:glutathione synthase [Hesseltinella vesiculosa]
MTSYHQKVDMDQLTKEAIDWALAHGLVVRPTVDKQQHFKNNAAVIHAPLALYPTPFPRHEFVKAKELQQPWNSLIHKMSQDNDLIQEVMETLSNVDDFMKQLYSIYMQVQQQGVAQSASLGIHRCDYLLHADVGQDASNARIQQVEFNTIASSFGSLSTRMGQLHRYLLSAIDHYGDDKIVFDQLPENDAISAIADGLASGWKLYNKNTARVMMIVQPDERNAFDQRWIEYALQERHGVHLLRRSMTDVIERGQFDEATKTLSVDGHEIAVVYYRAGYGPEDYHGPQEWAARLMMEKSQAIKCPTVAYQLVGAKKVQQVLAMPGRLEKYVDDATAAQLRESFAGLYPLDQSPQGKEAYQMALQSPERFVLKPQREGGGNNVYGDDIEKVLTPLSEEGRMAYILMDLIRTPPVHNAMLREGQVIQGQVVSELGIYGIYLSDGNKEVVNNVGGHLLRTKGVETKEGGVAAGFAVIDSPLLV